MVEIPDREPNCEPLTILDTTADFSTSLSVILAPIELSQKVVSSTAINSSEGCYVSVALFKTRMEDVFVDQKLESFHWLKALLTSSSPFMCPKV